MRKRMLARDLRLLVLEIRTKHIPDTKRGTVQAHVREHVAPGAAVYTDALPSYVGLAPSDRSLRQLNALRKMIGRFEPID